MWFQAFISKVIVLLFIDHYSHFSFQNASVREAEVMLALQNIFNDL